jgi:hypothetical protein
MSKIKSVSNSVAGKLGLMGGAALAASGLVMLLHPHRGATSDVAGWNDYLTLGLFAIALASMAPLFFALTRYASSRRAGQAAAVAAAGTILLAGAVISSIAHGHDYGFFVVVAPLANAAWFIGAVVIAVALKRAGRVPTAVAVCLPLVQIATLPLAALGGPILAGGYLMAVGYLLANDAIERAGRRLADPARA